MSSKWAVRSRLFRPAAVLFAISFGLFGQFADAAIGTDNGGLLHVEAASPDCPQGGTLLDGSCFSSLTKFQRDMVDRALHRRPAGSIVVASTVCAPGLANCSGHNPPVCLNLQSDANNCGTCGNVCSSGQSCVNGLCSTSGGGGGGSPVNMNVTPNSSFTASGSQGGPFSPSLTVYTVTAPSGTATWSVIAYPNWLTPSAFSGSANSSGTTITFAVNSNANGFSPGVISDQIQIQNDTGGNGSVTLSAQLDVLATTSTTVTSSHNPSAAGQSVSFTAHVTSTSAGTPAGTVFFFADSSFIGSGTLNSEFATFSTSSLSVGNHSITTSYGGDSAFAGSNGSLTGNPQVVLATTRVWVSAATGNDSNPCTRSSPCKTFAAAYAIASAGGEIDVLGPGDYGPLTITHAISIYNDSVGTGGALTTPGTSGITVNAGASDVVNLRGLTFNGQAASGASGVVFSSGAQLHIANCSMQGFATSGVTFAPASGNAALVIQDTSLITNGTGLLIKPASGASANVVLNRVHVDKNAGGGLRADGTGGSGTVSVAVKDSSVSLNASNGVNAVSGPGNVTVSISHSVISSNALVGIQSNQSKGGTASVSVGASQIYNNSTGVQSVGGGTLVSYQKNQFTGNTSNGSFTGNASLQ